MNNLSHIQNIYFIGIGGIGMSALAQYLHQEGKTIQGYDKTPSDITKKLENLGITIVYHDDYDTIPTAFSPQNTLVVYTPAIPQDSRILNGFQKNGFKLVKRAQLLGEVSQSSKCLAVAGTHGKTTTSSILAHLLADTNESVTAFLGGVTENYNSNFIQQGNEITVLEADEFDRSFLHLKPFIAGITSMDADHLDIYGNDKSVKEAFTEFANLVSDKKRLLHKKGLPLGGLTVAVGEPADFEAQNVRIVDGHYQFDLKTPHTVIKDLMFKLPGHHNLFNATLALGMAITLGSQLSALPKALFSFNGVKRRFSYKIKTESRVLIDDYAHHPEEINAVFQALSEMYPNEKKLVIFQPHLFSRTRDFGDEFAKSLQAFDQIFLLEIYPAREKPIPGINSQWLLDKIQNPEKKLISKDQMVSEIKNSPTRIVIMMGAGDIGEEVDKVVKNISI